ncbi:MAG: hypothetical protein OHK0029_24860 [Armatimonadaceae bacterium]
MLAPNDETVKPAWLDALFASIDAKDTDTFASFLADDSVFVFGNAEPVHGRQAIHQMVEGFLQSIAGIEHHIIEGWEHPASVICRGTVTYTRHNGTKLSVPFANVFKMKGDKIREYLVYVDISTLYTA